MEQSSVLKHRPVDKSREFTCCPHLAGRSQACEGILCGRGKKLLEFQIEQHLEFLPAKKFLLARCTYVLVNEDHKIEGYLLKVPEMVRLFSILLCKVIPFSLDTLIFSCKRKGN